MVFHKKRLLYIYHSRQYICNAVLQTKQITAYAYDTAGVMKTVPFVFTLLIGTIYLSHTTQVAGGTVFGGNASCMLTTLSNSYFMSGVV